MSTTRVVADIRAVFLEGETHHQNARPLDGDAALEQRLDQLLGDVGAHAVVEASAGEDELRVVADRLRFVREVVGIDADAVAANEAGTKRQEIPLGAGRLQHRFGVEAHAVEDNRKLVDQRDIEVALGVLDHLGGFSHFDAGGFVRPGGDDLFIKLVHQFRRFGG